jgi:hypothetical protein
MAKSPTFAKHVRDEVNYEIQTLKKNWRKNLLRGRQNV